MTNRVQTLRSSTSGNTPASGTRLPGELWTNFPDMQLGVIDTSKNAQKLLAVRFFSTLANYVAGDIVVQGGVLYTANVPITAGAFNPAQWSKNASLTDIPAPYVLPTASVSVLGGVKIDGTTITISSGVITATGGVFIGASPPVSPLVGGLWFDSVGGQLYVYYDDGNSKQWVAAINQNISGAFMPISGGTFTGPVNGVTPTTGDNSTLLATTAFVKAQASGAAPIMDGTASAGSSLLLSRSDHVHPSDTTKFPYAGGLFTGMIGVSGGWSLTTAGAFQFNGGGQFYASTIGGNTVNVNNANLQSSSYIGMLANTPNSFGSNATYIWGTGHYCNFSGGGGLYSRIDRNDASLCGWLWGTSSLVGTITTNGSTVSYNSSSDGRLKKNIRDLTDDLDPGALIDAMRPVSFEWRNRRHNSFEPGTVLLADDGKREPLSRNDRSARGSAEGHGFIAQELIKVAPFAVHAPDDGEREVEFDFEKGTHPWGVDFSKLVPYLVAEVQQLRKRVAQLEFVAGRG